MSYTQPRQFYAAAGLGQTKTASSSTSTAKTGSTSSRPDQTASDWAAGLTAFAPLIGGIVGAATGQQQPAPATTEPAVDPAAATAAPVSASPSWYWPVIIGVGVAVLGGIGYMSYSVKAPLKANRRRSRRKSRRKSRRMLANSEWGGTPGPGKKLWIWSWVGGGWNSGFASSKAEATKLAKEMGIGEGTRQTLVPTNVHVAAPGELNKLSAGWD